MFEEQGKSSTFSLLPPDLVSSNIYSYKELLCANLYVYYYDTTFMGMFVFLSCN